MRRIISIFLILVMAISMTLTFTGCELNIPEFKGEQGEKGDKGEQGEQGIKGDRGESGATIQKVEFDEQGRLIITLTDGTVLEPVEIPEKPEKSHDFSEWYTISASTCSKPGIELRLCTICNYTESRFTETGAHDYQYGICEICGVSNYDIPNSEELVYVAFGDSITYGIDGTKDKWGLMPEPYPTLVGNLLGLGKVQNKAISGATLCSDSGHTNMTEKILSFNGDADIISIMLGVNDYQTNRPLGNAESRDNSTVYGSLFMIADYLSKNYSDSFIFFTTPFPTIRSGGNSETGKYDVAAVAEAIKYVAAMYDIPVLDLYTIGKYELEMNLATNDGIHPSQEHFRKYTAPQIAWFISAHLNSKTEHRKENIVYQNVYRTGYVKNNGEIVPQTKHYYCSIPAAGVKQIIVVPPTADEYNTNNLSYVVYVDENGKATCYAPLKKNTPTVIELPDGAQGTIYFNAFVDELNFIYVKEATVVYSQ